MASSDEPTFAPVSSAAKSARRLRAVALVILLLGMMGGGVVYWKDAPPEDLSDEIATPDTSKRVDRDIEVNVGKMGLFTSDLLDDLRDPGTCAGIIVGAAVLISAGCFYLARLMDYDAGGSKTKTDSSDG